MTYEDLPLEVRLVGKIFTIADSRAYEYPAREIAAKMLTEALREAEARGAARERERIAPIAITAMHYMVPLQDSTDFHDRSRWENAAEKAKSELAAAIRARADSPATSTERK